MRENALKKKLRQGQAAAGAFVNIPSPTTVELLGHLGMDFAILDAEHTSIGAEAAEEMCRAAESSGITPVVRVGVNLQQVVLKYMDAGAMGAQVPLVNTAEEAVRVVESVKYPPLGKRGLAGVRVAGYGLGRGLGEYVRQANEETLVIVQVETVQAAGNIGAILDVPGVDVVFMGPTDISSSLGHPGQTLHPDVVELIERLGREVSAAGKVAGTLAPDPEDYRYWRERGFLYLCTSASRLLGVGARAYLKAAK